jgi:2-polyprenyl-6-methoxyphenol hydroxylase-like FAD-dependent oxidoreductase
MNDTIESVDVLVVGAGPSGLTLAAALAREGVRALTVERHETTSIFPKATGVRMRTVEILRSWGVADLLPDPGRDTRLVMSIQPTLAGPQLDEVPLGAPAESVGAVASPGRLLFLAQDRLEPVLLAHARERGADVRFGTEVTHLDIRDDGVTATIRPAAGGPARRIDAGYVVGADGGNSVVRAASGIGWRSLGSEGEHLSVLFRGDLSAAVRERDAALFMTVAPGAEGMFVATGELDRWVFDREWRPDLEPLSDWTPKRVRDTVRAASGLADLDPVVEGLFPWEFGAAVADTQRAGRVFLVGDAAHRTTPRRATGMNTGIADAHNLGWKLAWVLAGWAGPGLLDSYDAERRPVGVANAQRSLESVLDQDDPSPGPLDDDLRVVYRSTVVDDTEPALSAGGPLPHRELEARPGARAPHGWVERWGVRLSMLDLFDGRLTVVAGPRAEAWRAAACELGADGPPVRVVSLTPGPTDDDGLHDADGLVAARYGVDDGSALLVRPDGHVAARLPAPRPGASGDARWVLAEAVDRALGWTSTSEAEELAV